jgi:hypothetical protein
MTDERQKRWKQLLETDAAFRITSVKVIESNVFQPQLIDIPRVLALVGVHGAGKTLLLRMIDAAFGGDGGGNLPPFFGPRMRRGEQRLVPPPVEGIIEVTLRASNRVLSHTIDLALESKERLAIWQKDLGELFDARYVDPPGALFDISLVAQEYHIWTRPERISRSRNLNLRELRVLNHILGREYTGITVNAVSYDQAYEVPFITAVTRSRQFDLTAMSYGELWVQYVLNWFLQEEVNEGDLVLLDEPEAYLSARARRPFIDEVAHHALASKSQLILGTHSPEVLARFPLENILMCVPEPGGVRVIKPASFVQIRDSIGIETPLRALILVEDELAKQLLSGLFSRFDLALTRETEIVAVGGESEVRNGLRVLQDIDALRVLGVLDGDQRAETSLSTIVGKRPILFLPGGQAPEEELISSAIQNASWIAKILHVSPNDVIAAISTCRGLDHQYWLPTLASQLGQTQPAMVFVLLQNWLRDQSIRKTAEKLVRDIRSVVGS